MSTRYAQHPDAAWEWFRDEVVVLAPAARTVCRLNAVGAQVWACCDGRMTLDEIAQKIARRWNRSAEGVAGDVRAFCLELSRRGLLCRAGEDALRPAFVRPAFGGPLPPYVLPMIASEKGMPEGGDRDRVKPRSVTGLP